MVSTPLMGIICDSCTLRWGRYRTWFLFTPIFLLVDVLLLFSNPGFIQGSALIKCSYLCLTYLVYGICVTAYTMSHMAILPALTLDEQEHNHVIAIGAGVTALMFTIASTFSNSTDGLGGQLSQFNGHLRRVRTIIVSAMIVVLMVFYPFKKGFANIEKTTTQIMEHHEE